MACGGKCECADCSTATPPQGVGIELSPHAMGHAPRRERAGAWAWASPAARAGRGARVLRPEGTLWGPDAGGRVLPVVPGSSEDTAGLRPPQALERRLSRDEQDELARAERGPLAAAPESTASPSEIAPADSPAPLSPVASTAVAPRPPRPSPASFLLQPPGTIFGLGEFGSTNNRGKGGGGGPGRDGDPKKPEGGAGDAQKKGPKALQPPMAFAAHVMAPDSVHVAEAALAPCDCVCVCAPTPSTQQDMALTQQGGTGGANYLQPPYFVQVSATSPPMAVVHAAGSYGSGGVTPHQFSSDSVAVLRGILGPSTPLANTAAALTGLSGLEHAVSSNAFPASIAGNPTASTANAAVRAATSGQWIADQAARVTGATGFEAQRSPSGSPLDTLRAKGAGTDAEGQVLDDGRAGRGTTALTWRNSGMLGASSVAKESSRGDPHRALDVDLHGDVHIDAIEGVAGAGAPPGPDGGAAPSARERKQADKAKRDAEKRAREKKEKGPKPDVSSGGGGGGKVLELLTDFQRGTVTPSQPAAGGAQRTPLGPPLHPGGGVPGMLAIPAGSVSSLGAGIGAIPTGSWQTAGRGVGRSSGLAPAGSGLPTSAQPRGGGSTRVLGPPGSFASGPSGDSAAPLTPPAIQITSQTLKSSQFGDSFGGSKGQAVEDPFAWGKPPPVVPPSPPKTPPAARTAEGDPTSDVVSPAHSSPTVHVTAGSNGWAGRGEGPGPVAATLPGVTRLGGGALPASPRIAVPGGTGGASAMQGLGSLRGQGGAAIELDPNHPRIPGVEVDTGAVARTPPGGLPSGHVVSPSRADGWGMVGGGAGGGRGGGGGGGSVALAASLRTEHRELLGAAAAARDDAGKRAEEARYLATQAQQAQQAAETAVASESGSSPEMRDAKATRALIDRADRLGSEAMSAARVANEAEAQASAANATAERAGKDADEAAEKVREQNPGQGDARIEEAMQRSATPQAQRRAAREEAAEQARKVAIVRAELRDAVRSDKVRSADFARSSRQAALEVSQAPTLAGRVAAKADQYARESEQRRARELELIGLEQRIADLESDPDAMRDPANRKARAKLILDRPRRERERKELLREDRRQASALAKALRRLIARLEQSDDPDDLVKADELREQLYKIEDYLRATDPENHRFVKPSGWEAPDPTQAAVQIGLAVRTPTPPIQFAKAIYTPDSINRVEFTFLGNPHVVYADGFVFSASYTPVEPPQATLLTGLLCVGCSCGSDCPPGQCVCTKTYGPAKMPPPPPPGGDPIKPEGSGGGKLTPEDYKYDPVKGPKCPEGVVCQARPDDPVPAPQAPRETDTKAPEGSTTEARPGGKPPAVLSDSPTGDRPKDPPDTEEDACARAKKALAELDAKRRVNTAVSRVVSLLVLFTQGEAPSVAKGCENALRIASQARSVQGLGLLTTEHPDAASPFAALLPKLTTKLAEPCLDAAAAIQHSVGWLEELLEFSANAARCDYIIRETEFVEKQLHCLDLHVFMMEQYVRAEMRAEIRICIAQPIDVRLHNYMELIKAARAFLDAFDIALSEGPFRNGSLYHGTPADPNWDRLLREVLRFAMPAANVVAQDEADYGRIDVSHKLWASIVGEFLPFLIPAGGLLTAVGGLTAAIARWAARSLLPAIAFGLMRLSPTGVHVIRAGLARTVPTRFWGMTGIDVFTRGNWIHRYWKGPWGAENLGHFHPRVDIASGGALVSRKSLNFPVVSASSAKKAIGDALDDLANATRVVLPDGQLVAASAFKARVLELVVPPGSISGNIEQLVSSLYSSYKSRIPGLGIKVIEVPIPK